MKLDDKYRIEKNDTHGVTLISEETGDLNPQTGKPTKSIHRRYYNSIEQALGKYITLCVEDGLEAGDDVKELHDRLTEAIKNIKG